MVDGMKLHVPGFAGFTVFREQDCFIVSFGVRRYVAYALYALAAFGLAVRFMS